MFSTPIDLKNLGATAGSTTATNTNNATDAQASQDRFLKLLVAQINNQDPLNPMDNAQMTSQMAQINTVSGIQELNATLKGMADQMSATQSLQGATLIGREALVEGAELAYEGKAAKGAMSLPTAASQGTETVAATALSRVKVASVGVSNGAMNLQLANGRSVAYDKARGFM